MDFAVHLQSFGLSRFRPGQQEVIETVLAGQDCLCVMPTGGGKSLCYQLPSVVGEGLTIVVSPLIALMKDQVDRLTQRNVRAAFLNSSMSAQEQADCLKATEGGSLDLLYIAPERIRSSRFQEVVAKANVRLLAVDEAHCISEWGHDFRPDYSRLGKLRQTLGRPPTIALTATATPEVRQDVIKQLDLANPRVFVTGFARENLAFSTLVANGQREKELLLIDALRSLTEGGAIVYCTTRKTCEQVTEILADALNRPIGLYHAGLEGEQRRAVQDEFMSGDLDIIVATNAFGMGIDRGDLRLVLHYNMPGSLEAYYQEAGRAGRDGLPARCLLIFSYQDRHIHEYFIENAHPGREVLRDIYEYLRASPCDPVEITQQEVKEALHLSVGAECVGAAEQILERSGALRRLSSQQSKASFWIDTESPTLVDLAPREAKNQRKVLRAMEKLVGDQRLERVSLALDQVAAVANLQRESLNRAIRELSKQSWFDYAPPFRGRAIHIVDREAPFGRLNIDFSDLERRKQAEYAKLDRVLRYAQTRGCRQQVFLEYFGQHGQTTCGMCDNCRLGGNEKLANQRQSVGGDLLEKPIRMALSGVARGGGRFGKLVIAQMLCGSQSAKLTKWKLDRLSTFGLLGDCTQTEASLLLDELIRLELIEQVEVDRFKRVLRLSNAGAQVMKGHQGPPGPMHLPPELIEKLQSFDAQGNSTDNLAATFTEKISPPPTKPASDPAEIAHPMDGEEDNFVLGPADAPLLEQLRSWRFAQASQENIPAYRVLSNASLERIVQARPRSLDQLQHIKGIGPATISSYGPAILRHLASQPPVQAATIDQPPMEVAKPEPQPGHYWTCRLLADGYTLRECMAIRNLDPSQLFEDLWAATTDGWRLDGRRDQLTEEIQSQAGLWAADERTAQLLERLRRPLEE